MIAPQNDFPKTLIVDLSKLYGGSTSRVLSLVGRVPPGKISIATLASSAIGEEARRLNLPVHVIGNNKTDPCILTNLNSLIRRENFQVLDSQNIQSKFWTSLAAGRTNTALVSTIHSWYANEHGRGSLKGKIYTALELATNKHLKKYITVSQKDYLSLLQSGIRRDAVELIYNAVDINPDAILGSPEWVRTKFDLPHDSIVCIAVGRLVPVKGFDVLIKAIQQICKQIPQFTCLIVGDGVLKQELADQIQQGGLEQQVRLLGYLNRDAVLGMLKSSDIFVMPSQYEGTPIALLEAAAFGLPILASDTGGIPELVYNGEHALLVPPNDPTALANGLIRLCQDRQFARQLGEEPAQQRIREQFSLEAQVQATLIAYQKAWQKLQSSE